MSPETAIEEPMIEVCHGPECSDLGGRGLSGELEALGLKSCVGGAGISVRMLRWFM